MMGQIARWPLRLLPPTMVLPVMTGPNRGRRWTVGSLTHGCWIGWYERELQAKLVSGLRAGDVAYDIGANVGFFTLLMARLVGPTGHVHAFEPFPQNVEVLQAHLALNGCSNVTVHPVAVRDYTGTVGFAYAGNHAMGRASADGTLTVRCVALDDLDLPLPHAIKMDIEGGESLALCGMTRVLRAAQPLLLIEGHTMPRRDARQP